MSVHEHQHNFTPPTYTGEANMLNVGLGANKYVVTPFLCKTVYNSGFQTIHILAVLHHNTAVLYN